ncbi:MAG: cell wall-active antibiotics response protein [Oscillospiraceae bacterium]|nr:cell wall-active antibiotics response protein [Oscillospiraceae bacterium]
MIIMPKSFKAKTSKIAWGFFWLLLAGLVIANQFGGFVELGFWSIAIAVIATVVLFHCIISLSFASIAIPLAALYYIFQPFLETPLGLPEIPFWTLALVALLVTIALNLMLPKRFKSVTSVHVDLGNSSNKKRKRNKAENRFDLPVDDADVIIINNGDRTEGNERTKVEEGDDANNPYISVSFGYASRYLHSDCLESAELSCSFGGMEVYFDNVTLAPGGAEVNVNCSFGSIEIYVPSHWRVIDDLSASLANAEVSRKLQNNDADAPTLRITGSVSLGNVEVKRGK